LPPFEGFVQGGATIALSLQKPETFRAKVTLDTVQLNPRPSQVLRLGVQQQDVILKNSQPLVLDITTTAPSFTSAQFTGEIRTFRWKAQFRSGEREAPISPCAETSIS